jgi:phospholipid/cholesterol/gamma-HCH transport system substrate-binding protein
MRDGRRAARSLDRVLEQIEKNPQSFLFGGSTIPEYTPNQ